MHRLILYATLILFSMLLSIIIQITAPNHSEVLFILLTIKKSISRPPINQSIDHHHAKSSASITYLAQPLYQSFLGHAHLRVKHLLSLACPRTSIVLTLSYANLRHCLPSNLSDQTTVVVSFLSLDQLRRTSTTNKQTWKLTHIVIHAFFFSICLLSSQKHKHPSLYRPLHPGSWLICT